jgi:hypothetical protein
MLNKKIFNDFKNGKAINDFSIFAEIFSPGRFIEESNLIFLIKNKGFSDKLFHLKIYSGQKPYYNPWIEITNINLTLKLGRKIKYYDSIIESDILRLFSNYLNNSEKIFVEYSNDPETSYGLTYNFPIVTTRLGFILFNLGYTWFKDWYFPEGGNEGGQKLQGEKPVNEISKKGHIVNINHEIKKFLNVNNQKYEPGEYYLNAKKRGKIVLRKNG